MDLQKIGAFLSALRKEKGLTQEALGQKLGVTGKTVSRWECGTYLPPAEMLLVLSELYGLTVNELLTGAPLSDSEYRQAAEHNLQELMKNTSFSLQDRIRYYKRKWRREHIALFMINLVIALVPTILGLVYAVPLLVIIAVVAAAVFDVIRYNKMMAYVEHHAFDGKGS